MGKGKGKVHKWFTQIQGGVFLVEFVNLRSGRANYFVTQFSHKLNIKTKLVFKHKLYVNFPCFFLKKTMFSNF